MTWTASKWPDWGDAGRHVRVTYEGGDVVVGRLFVEEFFPDGAGDECPVFAVELFDGAIRSFADHLDWDFVEPSSAQTS